MKGVPYCVDRVIASIPSCSSTQNEPVQKYVQEVITRDKAAQSLRPSLGSAQRIAQELRSSKEAKRKENRYRVIASHRPNAPAADGKASTDSDRPGCEATEDASQKETSAVDESSDCGGKFQLFDIVQEDEVIEDPSATAANPQVSR